MFAKPRKEERERKASHSFSRFFRCPFNLSKKEMDSKELNKEDMKMSRGNRERERVREGSFPFPQSERRTKPPCFVEWLKESSQSGLLGPC